MSSKPSRDPLQQVRFDVRVTALATEVLQYQLYRNHGSKPIEAVTRNILRSRPARSCSGVRAMAAA